MRNHERTELSSMNVGSTDKKKPKTILRRGGKKDGNAMNFTTTAQTEDTGPVMEEVMAEMTIQPVIATEDTGAVVAVPEVSEQTPFPVLPALPHIPGFDLANLSRNQGYAVRSALVLCDCCVQPTAEAVADVISRNFDSPGSLCWWLQRIGKGTLIPRIKNKDIFDAVRIIGHALHRQFRSEIGLPIPRW
jgi:hypothetical protein